MSDVINGVRRELLERIDREMIAEGMAPNDELRALLTAQPQASALTEAAPGCFVQPVPSHCDRITWRGNYYQLPDGLTKASAAQSAPAGEREAFRAAHRELDLSEKPDAWGRPQFLHSHVEVTWRGFQAGASWQRTQSAVVPEGWRLVPVEPTPKMMRAGVLESVGALRVYYAMLAAAPAQPAAQEQFNRAHIMDALLMWNRRHEEPPIRAGYEYGVAEAVLDLAAAQDQGEVQSLREALEGVVKRCSKEHGGSGYVGRDGQYLKVIDAALAASTGQEVES